MSSDDEGELCCFGTPLDPIEEGSWQLIPINHLHVNEFHKKFCHFQMKCHQRKK